MMFRQKQKVMAGPYYAGLLCISIALWVNSGIRSLALDKAKSIIQYNHKVWRTEDGLPQNTVRAILQTREGYVWLATEDGLVRFDGIRFVVFDRHNTRQIKSNSIQVLYEDREGNLWVGTDGGLARCKDGAFTAYSTADGLSSDNVGSIYEDREGNLWVGTTGGLNRLNQGRVAAYTIKDGLPASSIRTIFEDRQGNLWVGTTGGLARQTGGKFTTYTVNDGLPANNVGVIYEARDSDLWFGTTGGLALLKGDGFIAYTNREGLSNNFVWAVHEDGEGNLWVGTDGGLNRFKDGRFITYTTRDGLSDNSVWSIYEDGSGSLWLGTPGGLTRLKGGQIDSYTTREGLSNNVVLSLCEDREGSLWVGTETGGLNLFKDRKFSTYTTRDGLPADMIWTVYIGRDGGLWVGSQGGGLSHLDGGKIATYTTRDGLASNIVRAICEDKEGGLWVGTPDGLSKMENGRFITYTVLDGLSSNAIWAIHEDGEGALWVGTLGGLSRMKDGKFTVYTAQEGLPDDSVLAIDSGDDNALWIGTRSGGLSLLKDGRFKTYTVDDGLSDNSVRALYEDEDGALWVGTRRGGLRRFKDGKFTVYSSKEGLFDDCVFQILEDGNGSLWMSGTKGVFAVSKNDLNDFADGRIHSITSVSYGTADGMESRECNGGQPAGCRGRDGKLWFPTTKGVAMIDPENMRINEEPPPVVIEQVIADEESLDPSRKAELTPGLYRLEFQYTGLSFIAPEKVRFKYKLEGFDKDWVDANNRRVAYYTSIPPGDYTFRVKACNNDGVWNERDASFGFYLKPHFYQTYWFYIALAALAGLIGWGLYRLRLRQLKAQFSTVLAERSRMARDIHDTLAQGFVGISLQLEAVGKMLDESPPRAKQHLDLAQNMVSHSLTEARRSVWDLRSHALDSADLAQALSDVARQLTSGTSVQAQLSVVGAPRRFDAAVENNLLRIGQEALTNAMKHAGAKKIHIELSFHQEYIQLGIRDDGCGFDTNDESYSDKGHFGLIGMRERAERLKGRLQLNSRPGAGTEILIKVPVS
jgi:ligand-binding sensor domain-containing protein/two-component sensor histidine kinase